MANLEYVKWEERFSVGIPLIDEQHKALIETTNDLYNDSLRGDEWAKKSFVFAAHMAVDYVKRHFTTEETLMKRYVYPQYAQHKKEHAQFIKRTLHEVEQFEKGKRRVPIQFAQFLREWLLAHIAISDKTYSEFLVQAIENEKG